MSIDIVAKLNLGTTIEMCGDCLGASVDIKVGSQSGKLILPEGSWAGDSQYHSIPALSESIANK